MRKILISQNTKNDPWVFLGQPLLEMSAISRRCVARPTIILSLLLVFLISGMCRPALGVAVEKPKRPLVIGVLVYSKNNLPTLEGFKAGLRERVYVDGQGVEYVFEGAVDSIKELDPAMARLMARKPDLVYAAPTQATLAAQKVCRERNIPVVFGPVNNAVVVGLVTDRKHPGGNITGVMLSDSDGKRLQWALEVDPRIKSILVPHNPEDPSSMLSFKNVQEAAVTLGVKVVAVEVRNPAEIDALVAHFPEGVDSIFLPRDALLMGKIKEFSELAIRKKILLSATRLELVEKGALLGYGFDGVALGKQVARLADQIFKGKKPGDLPVESAEDYLAINLKTAQAIGLKVDERILRMAYLVIRPE